MRKRDHGGDVADLAFERAKAEARELLQQHPSLRSGRTAAFLAGEGQEAEKMARPRGGKEQLTVRLPEGHLARLEALAPALADAPELATAGAVTRSDVLRLAILRGLEQLEAEYAGQPQLPGVGQ